MRMRSDFPRRRRLAHAVAMPVEQLEPRRLLSAHVLFPGAGNAQFQGPRFDVNPGQIQRLSLLNAPEETLGPAQVETMATPELTGSLAGKVVYVSPGHGFYWTGSSWTTQRGLTQGMVEDFGNQDQATFYAHYLLNAGATVVPMRPLGHQTHERIIDNADGFSGGVGFSIVSGSWGSSSTGWPYWSNGNGSETDRYRFASTSLTETAVARWTPNLPAAGFYPVYAWALNSGNRSTDHLFRINHAGGVTEVKVNFAYTGKGWVYLGNYYFNSGTGGNVELSNKSATTGKVVIADAVRFGNGMGDWNAGGGVSGRSREDEAAVYWAYRSRGFTAPGTLVATSIIDNNNSSHVNKDIVSRPRWSRYMNDETQGSNTDRLFLSFHSNAFNGSARGTLALIHNSSPTPNQAQWAAMVANEVQNDMVGVGSPPLEHVWATRTTTLSGSYGEISNLHISSQFAATIIEVAFHDNVQDAQLMRDPKVRDWVARSSYQATVKYFNTYSNVASTVMPDVPTSVRATTNASGHVTVSWVRPLANASTGGAGNPTGYKIYTSQNGYGFNDVVTVSGANTLSHTFTSLPTNTVTYFKVVAFNSAGESPQRDVVAAKPQSGRRAPILIVNGFDRFDRTTNQLQSWLGTSERVRWRYNNTRDYVVQFAEAIKAYNGNLGLETAQNEHVISGAVNLNDFHTVLWISGEESTADKTFDATEQSLVASYISNGGKFFASGSEIAWDLDAQNNGRSFYRNTLKAVYVADSAGTYTANGASGSIFAGINGIVFDNGAGVTTGSGTYNVRFADVINPNAGSIAAMTYSTGTNAAVQWSSGESRLVNMGFPFETITSATRRNQVMGAVLGFFNVNSTLESAVPGTPVLLAATDSGLSSSDRITNFNNSSPAKALQFSVSGTVSGATVTIYAGAVAIGSATASGTTTTVTTNGTTTLIDATHSITARQQELGKPISNPSGAISVTIDTTPPAAPGAALASTTTTTVNLDWPNNSESDLWGYDVYRATVTGGPYSKINGAVLTSSAFSDGGRIPGTNYYYLIRALDIAGNVSANSAESAATTVPLEVSGLAAAAVEGRRVELSWTLPGGNREGIIVQRRTGSDPFVTIATLGPSATAHPDDSGLVPGTDYDYQVLAFTGSTQSAPADASAMTWKLGDANGDGVINIDDYFLIDRGFAEGLSGWINGDFDGNGVVDQDDYDIIDAAYFAQ